MLRWISVLNALLDTNKIIGRPTVTIFAIYKQRIFTEGVKSDGAQIGTYSASYFRERLKKGRESGRNVVLRFTDKLANDTIVEKLDSNNWAIGIRGAAGGGGLVTSNFKAEVNEDRFGIIFELTDNEADILDRLVEAEVKRAIA